MADRPASLHAHALDHLRFIRHTMEHAGTFTALPGWGGVGMGTTAVFTAWIAGPPDNSLRWLNAWLADALVAAAIGVTATLAKMRASGVGMTNAATLRFLRAYAPPLAAGAILTAVFAAQGFITRLPGCWLLLYGTALASGGAFSVRIVPAMGMCFMALGVAAFAAPAAWGHWFMAFGFGGLHIAFGLAIARTYGG
jgi:hypothetical protein